MPVFQPPRSAPSRLLPLSRTCRDLLAGPVQSADSLICVSPPVRPSSRPASPASQALSALVPDLAPLRSPPWHPSDPKQLKQSTRPGSVAHPSPLSARFRRIDCTTDDRDCLSRHRLAASLASQCSPVSRPGTRSRSLKCPPPAPLRLVVVAPSDLSTLVPRLPTPAKVTSSSGLSCADLRCVLAARRGGRRLIG